MLEQERSEELIVQRLEKGTAVDRFLPKHKPESGILKIRRETHHLIWSCNQNASDVIITSLGDIKEVRPNQASKDFERWPEEARKVEKSRCFVVYYGKEFKLRSLSIAALGIAECGEWILGINFLRDEYAEGSYIICLERFLRTEFYSMKNNKSTISFRDVKAFLPKINLWTSSNRLKELFDAKDDQRQGEIGFDQFLELIMMITWDKQEDRKMLMDLDQYSEDKSIVTMQEFQAFLVEQQHELEYHAASIIRNFVQDLQRNIQEPYFHVEEFFQYLFSKSNEVWNRRHSYVNQDMKQPLSHYWVASSHNTYLTGDQLASDSSVEAYARALRQGCRCIELDCWDGPKETPIIYHGHTITSKIGFLEVIKTIKDHAFVTSSFPLILSIENHCSLPQQKEMARLFKEVFGNSLLTTPIESHDERGRQVMPSPEMLKGKVMLKYRKLPGGTDELTPLVPNADELGEQGLDQVLLSDRLFLKNPVDHLAWQPHLFFLSQNGCLSFTEAEMDSDLDGDDQANGWRHSFCDSDDERHIYQSWYHGKLPGGREKAQELLQQYSYLGDGTFLVRLSENFIGDHTLSFWNQGKANHCRIKTRQEGDRTTFRLKDTYSFPNLNALIEHYHINPIRAQVNAQNPNELSIVLGKPVPRPNDHERMEWYHANMTKEEAEEYLGRIQDNGAFLVRPSQEPNSISISFRAQGSTKHCRVKQVDQSYLFGTATFENLVDLVKYYKREPLYRNVKLRYPVTRRVIDSLPDQDQLGVGQPGGYITCLRYNVVKAKFNYTAQKPDELTFPRHAIIHNVNKVEENWWKGDYGGSRQYWFPANFVEEIQPENINEGAGDTRILGDLQKGNVDLRGSDAVLKPYKEENPWNINFVIRLTAPTLYEELEIGCVSEQKAREWMDSISSVASIGDTSFQQKETKKRIDKDLSDLVVYFQCVNFDIQRRCHNEISSFPETKMMNHIKENPKALLEFHKVGFSRVYPKSTRVDSSNYNPMPMWNHGCQLVSLNYQTGDKNMQLNEGMFLQNGKCGYVLRPKCQMDPNYDPSDPTTLRNKYPLKLEIKIFGARHLTNTKKGCISPMVELEIIGCDYDSQKISTRTVRDNGLNPVWGETMHFDVMNPECSLIRFVVNDVDNFGDLNQIGQATYPVLCLRDGFRSVPLKNNFSDEIELASLLIYLKQSKGVENPTSYVDHLQELGIMREEAERNNDHERANQLAEAWKRLEISMRKTSNL